MEWLSGRNIETFNGTRYGSWKFRIKSLLEELRVRFVIDEAPPENPNAEWIEKNSVAKCTIVNFLGDAFLHFAEGSATAKSIIDNLDKLYEKRTLYTQMALRKQLYNLKLLPNVSLIKHFTIFDTLIARLICSGANLDEMDKICHLLMTLPFSYDEVIEGLEVLHEEHFNLVFIKTMLLDHEAKMEIAAITKLKECQASDQTHARNNKRKTNNTHWNPNKRRKPNHFQDNRNFHGNPASSQMHCDFCGRNNHYIQDCYVYKRQTLEYGFNMHQNHNNLLMFPQFAPKVKRRFSKNNSSRNPPPRIDLTIKKEPISIKDEHIEIKDEPVWIKQEPEWDQNVPILVKTEPVEQQQETDAVPEPQNGLQIVNVNGGPRRKNRGKRRTRAHVIAMHVQAESAGQAQGNRQPAI